MTRTSGVRRDSRSDWLVLSNRSSTLLKELALKFTEQEMRDFYRLLNNYPDHAEVSWELAPAERIKFYQQQGCRKGDAVIAAHAEVQKASVIVSENRQFLQTMSDLSMEISSPQAALEA